MPNWRKVVVSGSDAVLNSLYVTGSVTASAFTGAYTGSLFGTSSWAQNAISSSYAVSSSYAFTASSAVNSFNAITASYALRSGAAVLVTGSNAILNQSTPATTWSFDHYLNNRYPVFQVFNSANEVIIPEKIVATSTINALIYFPTAISGIAVADIGGYTGSQSIATASYAFTASYAINAGASFPFTGSAQITGSLGVTGSTSLNSTLNTSTVITSVVGSNTILTQATGSYTSAFYKYAASSGSNARSGEIVAVWNGTTVQYTDYSTVDIGSTSTLSTTASLSGGNILLTAQTSLAGWTIKALATYI